MSQVREYNVTVRVKLATYESDAEVALFAKRLAAMLAADIESERDYVFKTNPTVEVTYATK